MVTLCLEWFGVVEMLFYQTLLIYNGPSRNKFSDAERL